MCLFFLKELQNQTNFNYSKDFVYVRGMQTNGHDWKLFEVNDLYVKKTTFYKPKNKFYLKRDDREGLLRPNNSLRPFIWEDNYHMSSIIGLIRFTLSKIFIF